MAYATTNPPVLVSQPLAGPREWVYSSADAAATVYANNYFTNGYELGIRHGDFVRVINTSTSPIPTVTMHTAKVASKVVDLTDGLAIGIVNT